MIDASSAIPGYSATDVDGLLSSFNRVVFSTALDMARFGLFISQGASWDGAESPLSSQFYDAMISPSQSLNPSYGYLWWLNGQDFFPFQRPDWRTRTSMPMKAMKASALR